MKIRLLSAADVVQALPMSEAIEGMKAAYAQLSDGRAVVPLRSRIDVPELGADFGDARLSGTGGHHCSKNGFRISLPMCRKDCRLFMRW